MSREKPDHHSRNIGPGKSSGIKSTAKEVTNRIRQAADLLCSGHRRSQIVELMASEYGVHWRTVDEYCVRARELLLEESGKPKEEHRAEVLGEYQVVLRDKKAAHSDKLQALKGKREMLGLDSPRRTEISGPQGAPIQTEEVQVDLSPDRLKRLISTLENGEAKPDMLGNGHQK